MKRCIRSAKGLSRASDVYSETCAQALVSLPGHGVRDRAAGVRPDVRPARDHRLADRGLSRRVGRRQWVHDCAAQRNRRAERHRCGRRDLSRLIDLHNHLTWNLLPRWKPNRLFANRYEWQETAEYAERLSGPNAALNGGLGDPLNSYACDMNRYGELKAVINGATSTVGGAFGECIRGLARNLDALSELTPNQTINTEPFRNLVFPFQPLTPCEEQAIRDIGHAVKDCSEYLNVPPKEGPATRPRPPTLNAVVAHVAEGIDASARREFTMLESHGFLVPGLSIIHGVPLQREQFYKMARAGVGFIWSPRSNLEMYGRTADIAAAIAVRDDPSAGKTLTMAIAPDWSPSGSTGMLAELAYVERLRQTAPFDLLTEKDLVEMATINPAKLAGLDSRIGRIAPGYASDLIVMRKRPRTQNSAPNDAQMQRLAYQALLMQTPADLKLVVIGGVPVFGEPALMGKLLSAGESRTGRDDHGVRREPRDQRESRSVQGHAVVGDCATAERRARVAPHRPRRFRRVPLTPIDPPRDRGRRGGLLRSVTPGSGLIAVARLTGNALAVNAAIVTSTVAPTVVGQSVTRNAEQLAFDQAAQTPHHRQCDRDAAHEHQRGLTQDQPHRRAARGAECDSDADLTRTMRHDEGHDPVHADQRQQDSPGRRTPSRASPEAARWPARDPTDRPRFASC